MSGATTSAPSFRMGSFEWLMMLACAFCWGSAYIFNKVAIAELPSLTITASRLLLAALLLQLLCRMRGIQLPWSGRAWAPFFVYTIFSNVAPFLFVLHGQKETAAGLAAVIGSSTPLFVILLAHVWTHDEKLRGRKIVGVLVGLVGVAVVIGSEALSFDGPMIAKGSLLVASMLYAIGAIFAKRLTRYEPMALAAMQMTAGFIVALPLALLIDLPWQLPMPSSMAMGAIAGTAVIGSSLAAITYFHVLRRAGATNAMLVTLLVPITPIVLGALLFGERLQAREILGGLIVAAALVIIDGRFAAYLKSLVTRSHNA
jgi:drug/metabolite transporter (DMT)-like permease